jgi:hypothetical protein
LDAQQRAKATSPNQRTSTANLVAVMRILFVTTPTMAVRA